MWFLELFQNCNVNQKTNITYPDIILEKTIKKIYSRRKKLKSQVFNLMKWYFIKVFLFHLKKLDYYFLKGYIHSTFLLLI